MQGGSTEVLLSTLWDAVVQRTSEQAGGVQVRCPQLHTMEVWKEMYPVLCVSTDEMQEGWKVVSFREVMYR